MPWKVLGRKWHLLRKGFPSGKRVHWAAETLDKLFDVITAACPAAEFDWGNKQLVHIRRNGSEAVWASIITKRREGIDLLLYQQPGAFALGRISRFAAEQEITPHRDGREAIKLRFKTTAQVTATEFREFLAEHARM